MSSVKIHSDESVSPTKVRVLDHEYYVHPSVYTLLASFETIEEKLDFMEKLERVDID